MHGVLRRGTVLGTEAGEAVGVRKHRDSIASRGRGRQIADDACRRIVAPIIYEDDFVEDPENRAKAVRDLLLFVPHPNHGADTRPGTRAVQREVVPGESLAIGEVPPSEALEPGHLNVDSRS